MRQLLRTLLLLVLGVAVITAGHMVCNLWIRHQVIVVTPNIHAHTVEVLAAGNHFVSDNQNLTTKPYVDVMVEGERHRVTMSKPREVGHLVTVFAYNGKVKESVEGFKPDELHALKAICWLFGGLLVVQGMDGAQKSRRLTVRKEQA